MSGSLPSRNGAPASADGQDHMHGRERWFVAIITALGGIAALVWLFWRLVPTSDAAADWNTLAKLAVAVLLALAITAMPRFALAPLGRGKPMPTVASAATSDPDAAVRRWITPIVFCVGSGAIIVLALGLVIAFAVLAADDPTLKAKLDTLLNGIFGAVLPIFATWVGTVIAFYFTSSTGPMRTGRGGGGERIGDSPHRVAPGNAAMGHRRSRGQRYLHTTMPHYGPPD